MALKSAWDINGERIREVKLPSHLKKTGWIERGNLLMYAERYDKKLMVKTYSNKTQCNKKIFKLKKVVLIALFLKSTLLQ